MSSKALKNLTHSAAPNLRREGVRLNSAGDLRRALRSLGRCVKRRSELALSGVEGVNPE